VGLMLARLGDTPRTAPLWTARLRAAIEFVLSPKMRLRLLLVIMVDFNLQIPANALTIVVILAMGWIASELPSKRRHKNSSEVEVQP